MSIRPGSGFPKAQIKPQSQTGGDARQAGAENLAAADPRIFRTKTGIAVVPQVELTYQISRIARILAEANASVCKMGDDMAGSVNKVILVGNLGADPEVRQFPSGGKVCELRVATSERWKDRNTGENRERTEWHRVSIYNEHLVRVAEQWLRKGSLVYVEGQLETRKWQDQNGHDRYTTDVALRAFRGELRMLGSRSDNEQSYGDRRGSAGGFGQNRAERQQGDDTFRQTDSPQTGANGLSSTDNDDEIPF